MSVNLETHELMCIMFGQLTIDNAKIAYATLHKLIVLALQIALRHHWYHRNLLSPSQHLRM